MSFIKSSIVLNSLSQGLRDRVSHIDFTLLFKGKVVKAAIAGYLLRLWNIDCSNEGVLLGYENYLVVNNLETLYSVDNLAIAPGFEQSKSVRNLNV